MKYDLYSEFDLTLHKQNFTNYLEIIIHPTGKIEYAVPSHQEKLISIATQSLDITSSQLCAMCPEEYYFDFMTWLCKITRCVSVWSDYYVGNPNRFQRSKLNLLEKEGLFRR